MASQTDLFYWINERHRIYLKRKNGEPAPWTEDPILQEYKFTNVFRELDHGTIVLRQLEKSAVTHEQRVFYTIFYRMINLAETLQEIGFLSGWSKHVHNQVLRVYGSRRDRRLPFFTSAHMTMGRLDERKIDTYSRSFEYVQKYIEEITHDLGTCSSLDQAFRTLLNWRIPGVGPFIGYEIISDLRWSILAHASDIMTWANIGPGCKRGLRWLGMPIEVGSLRELLKNSEVLRGSHVPSLEMREIEHSLCEFDKYWRTRVGTSRPKARYRNSRQLLKNPSGFDGVCEVDVFGDL